MTRLRDWGLSGIGATAGALAPIAACPGCWPAYIGIASALGVGAVAEPGTSLWMTVGFLAVALIAIGFRARRRRGYGPLLVAVAGAVAVMIGRLVVGNDAVINAGGLVVVVGAVWNAWPRRAASCELVEITTRTELTNRTLEKTG